MIKWISRDKSKIKWFSVWKLGENMTTDPGQNYTYSRDVFRTEWNTKDGNYGKHN